MLSLLMLPLMRALTFFGAGNSAPCAKPTFFGLVPWYQYLTVVRDGDTGQCAINNFGNGANAAGILGSNSPFLLIGLAVIDDLIRVAALVAVGFIIYGGFTYMTSQGSPESTGQAKSSIINALTGLVIAIVAIGFVSYLGNTLGGNQVGGTGIFSTLPNATANQSTISTVLQIVFSIAGSVALLMIVIGGFRYILARGEPGEVSKAKNTLIYAIIGLIVSMAAFSIVTFVIKGVS